MATTTDNTGNVPWKPLLSTRWDLDLRGYVSRADGEVPHATAATTIASTIVEAEVQNERDVHKSRKITETLTAAAVLDKDLGTAWGELRRFATDWTTTKEMVSTSAVPSGGFLVVVGENREHNPANFKRDVITVSAWEERTSRLYDDDLGLEVTLVESVVANTAGVPPALTSPTATTWETIREVDFWRSIKSAYTFAAVYARTSYETIQYTFPALLTGITYVTQFEEANERTVWQITPVVRAAFSVPVRVNVYDEVITAAEAAILLAASDNVIPFGSTGTAFLATPTADLGTASMRARLFNPKPTDIIYHGVMIELNVPNVLTNVSTDFTDNLVFTSNGADTYYGAVVDTVSFAATEISASEYLALVGKIVCIEDAIVPWRFGLFRRRRQTIKLQ